MPSVLSILQYFRIGAGQILGGAPGKGFAFMMDGIEVGMAKLLASEYCMEVTQESFRIHGGLTVVSWVARSRAVGPGR